MGVPSINALWLPFKSSCNRYTCRLQDCSYVVWYTHDVSNAKNTKWGRDSAAILALLFSPQSSYTLPKFWRYNKASLWEFVPLEILGNHQQGLTRSVLIYQFSISYKVCRGLTKCWGSMVHLRVSEFSKSVSKLIFTKQITCGCSDSPHQVRAFVMKGEFQGLLERIQCNESSSRFILWGIHLQMGYTYLTNLAPPKKLHRSLGTDLPYTQKNATLH